MSQQAGTLHADDNLFTDQRPPRAAASQAALAHACDHLRWPTVETCMKDSNRAARALALRLGGVRIDRPVFPDGIARGLFRLPPPTAGAFIPIQT